MTDRKPKKVSRPLKRRLHIRGQEWTYQMSSKGVTVRSPSGKKTRIRVPYDLIPGYTWDDLERDLWKGNGPRLTPAMVKTYVETNVTDD